MNNNRLKIKEIFLPFLIVSFGTILAYNIIRWTLNFRFGLINMQEELLNFWIPFTIPWIPVFFLLRKRIRLLKINENGYPGYQFAMVGAIAVPIIISQYYIERAPFELIQLDTVNHVQHFPEEKYFTLKDFDIKKDVNISYAKRETVGKSMDQLNFDIYFGCLFEESKSIWCGIKFHKSMSNWKNEREKRLLYNDFIKISKLKLSRLDFQETKYFEKLSHSKERNNYLTAIRNRMLAPPVILIPRNGDFEERLENTVRWFFGSLCIGSFIILGMILLPKIDQIKLEESLNRKKSKLI